MAIVIDASIVAAWVFPDEDSSLAREAAEVVRGRYGLVPSLFWFEVRNLLWSASGVGGSRPSTPSPS
jgi:hypothetical protein